MKLENKIKLTRLVSPIFKENVVALFSEGKSTRWIADYLIIGPATIEQIIRERVR